MKHETRNRLIILFFLVLLGIGTYIIIPQVEQTSYTPSDGTIQLVTVDVPIDLKVGEDFKVNVTYVPYYRGNEYHGIVYGSIYVNDIFIKSYLKNVPDVSPAIIPIQLSGLKSGENIITVKTAYSCFGYNDRCRNAGNLDCPEKDFSWDFLCEMEDAFMEVVECPAAVGLGIPERVTSSIFNKQYNYDFVDEIPSTNCAKKNQFDFEYIVNIPRGGECQSSSDCGSGFYCYDQDLCIKQGVVCQDVFWHKDSSSECSFHTLCGEDLHDRSTFSNLDDCETSLQEQRIKMMNFWAIGIGLIIIVFIVLVLILRRKK